MNNNNTSINNENLNSSTRPDDVLNRVSHNVNGIGDRINRVSETNNFVDRSSSTLNQLVTVDLTQSISPGSDSDRSFASAIEHPFDQLLNAEIQNQNVGQDQSNIINQQNSTQASTSTGCNTGENYKLGTYPNPIIVRLPSATFNNEPYFKFGPYIPFSRKDNEIIIHPDSMVREYVDIETNPLAKRITREMLPEDSIIEAPSLVTPFLLKKRTKWPLKDSVEKTTSTSNPDRNACDADDGLISKMKADKTRDDLYNDHIYCNQIVGNNYKQVEIVKLIYRKDSDDPIQLGEHNSNMRATNEYVRHATVVGLTNEHMRPEKPLSIRDYSKTRVSDMLMNIGLNQAKEVMLTQDIKRLTWQVNHDQNKCAEQIQDLDDMKETLDKLKNFNKPYKPTTVYPCAHCDFKANSMMAYIAHMEVPHVNRRDICCNWCYFKTRDTNVLNFHTMVSHRKRCRFDKPNLITKCDFCPYESNYKKRSLTHIENCRKNFKLENNLGPHNYNHEDPPALTMKPINRHDVLCYQEILREVALSGRKPSRIKMGPLTPHPGSQNSNKRRSNMVTSSPDNFTTNQNIGLDHVLHANNVDNHNVTNIRIVKANNISTSSLSNLASVNKRTYSNISGRVGSESPIDKDTTFVICEICDSYITDLQHLKIHMQIIHKVKLQSKILQTRPPLACARCGWRFFTDQGLERHLLGLHGLVTTHLQDQVDQDMDSGRCTKCGRAFGNKLVVHMKEVHKITLKSASLAYKCTVCGAIFNLYRLFENHIYTVHSDAIKQATKVN